MTSDNGDKKQITFVSAFVFLWQLLFGFRDDKEEDEPKYKENKNGRTKE